MKSSIRNKKTVTVAVQPYVNYTVCPDNCMAYIMYIIVPQARRTVKSVELFFTYLAAPPRFLVL